MTATEIARLIAAFERLEAKLDKLIDRLDGKADA